MPWESIGDFGTGQMPNDREWIIHGFELAIKYLEFILDDPPVGCELGVMWHEHERGEYSTVGIFWGAPQPEPPWQYIRKCEFLLTKLDEAITWSDIEPDEVLSIMDEEFLVEGDNDT